jgi:membrane protein implicated in regulation of membrane protease activity
MPIWAEWWFWLSASLVLATAEVILPGYIFLGFAVGAFVLGAGMFLGLTGMSLPFTLVIFAVLSLAAYLGLRYIFGLKSGQVKIWEKDINDIE